MNRVAVMVDWWLERGAVINEAEVAAFHALFRR